MTAMSTVSGTTTTRLRAGLALSALLGLMNVGFLAVPTPDGGESPPVLVIVVSAVLGLVQVGCAAIAWPSGSRLAIRVNAAILIINALLSMPAFFVDIDAWVKAVSALSVILTVVALVLTLRREHEPFTVTD